jgi:hypothetical protein
MGTGDEYQDFVNDRHLSSSEVIYRVSILPGKIPVWCVHLEVRNPSCQA